MSFFTLGGSTRLTWLLIKTTQTTCYPNKYANTQLVVAASASM